MSKFKRENRYVVLKISDLEKLGQSSRDELEVICQNVELVREATGKRPLRCVVVEDDWPEHEQVWAMIEARCSANKKESL